MLLLLKDLHVRTQKLIKYFWLTWRWSSYSHRTVDRKSGGLYSFFFKCLKRAPGRPLSPAWSPASQRMTPKSLLRNTSPPLNRGKRLKFLLLKSQSVFTQSQSRGSFCSPRQPAHRCTQHCTATPNSQAMTAMKCATSKGNALISKQHLDQPNAEMASQGFHIIVTLTELNSSALAHKG